MKRPTTPEQVTVKPPVSQKSAMLRYADADAMDILKKKSNAAVV
jgi:hypothetical protein